MPHFENIDQYEASHPENGRKRIIPIAPHSLQATDYKPHKSGHAKARKPESRSGFEAVEFEPISVRQMEKEFKAASRNGTQRPRRSGNGGLLSSLLAKLKSFFKGKEKPRKSFKRRSGGRRRIGGQPSQKPDPKAEKSASPEGKRRRRNRSGKGRRGGNSMPQGQESPKRQEGSGNSRRSRRGRRPSGQSGPSHHPQKRNRPGGKEG